MVEQTIKKLSVDSVLIMEYEEISGKGVKYRNRILKSFMTEIKFVAPIGFKVDKHLVLGEYIELNPNGELSVYGGYEWNGPNVMRDKPKAMRASIAHDSLCELVAAGLLDKKYIPQINDLFQTVCKEDGMAEWKANMYRKLLRSYWQGWFRPYK